MMNANGHAVVTGWTLPNTPNATGVLPPSERDDFRMPSGEHGMVTHANAGSSVFGSQQSCGSCGRTDTLCSDCEQMLHDAIKNG